MEWLAGEYRSDTQELFLHGESLRALERGG